MLILLQRGVQLSYFTFLAYWNAFVGVEENFGYPCYPSPSQLQTEGASMIENIIREVKAEIQRLNQVVRLLEGTKATKQATAPRRKMSAAGRRRIAAAQKARWAKVRAAAKK